MSGRSMRKFIGVLAAIALCSCSNDWSAGLADKRVGSPAGSSSSMSLGQAAVASAALRARGHRSFANAPDKGSLVQYPKDQVVRRTGAYTWYAADLSEDHALRSTITGKLNFAAPDGSPIELAYERHVEHADGNWSWIGRAEGERGESTVITFGDEAVFGSIPQGRDQPPLRLTIANGRAWVVSADPRLLREIRNDATHPTDQDFLVPPKLASTAAATTATGGIQAMEAEAVATTATGKTVVDVLVGFTDGYAAYRTGTSAAITRIHNLVEATNQAYRNSQVNAEVRLVHSMQISYPDATANKTALEELTGFKAPSTRTTPAPAFSALRSARDQYGADVVVLLRRFQDPENDGCGIAWLIGGGRSGIDASDEFFGYSVVSDGEDAGTDGKTYFCRDETLAHEIGHNMGSQHDADNAKKDDGSVSYGAYDYSFGYRTASGAGNFYTVMAYGDSGQTRNRVFSNPNVSICGIDSNLVCGVVDQADNARSLAQTIPVVAGFRGTVVSYAKASGDVDGDGRSDILWHNAISGELYYWAMNGTTIAGGQGGVNLPVGYAALGTGDFDGDGRSDVVSANGSDVRISLSQGWGTYGSAIVVSSRPPAGWTFAGAADLNGDGRSEILWHNVISGEIYWWALNGAVIVGGQGGASIPVGHNVLGLGDLNGDGLGDLLSANGSDVRVSFARSTGALADAVVVAARPAAGWRFAGAADVTGDRRADIVWHNVNSDELYYWAMNGSTVTGGQGGAFLGAGQTVLGLGDVNGDGRADVISASGAYVHISISSGPSFAASSVIAGRPPAGWSHVSATRRNGSSPDSDVSGDSKSDVIWHNVNSGELYYWVMSGPAITAGQGSAYLPLGHVALAFGDFNGDGRADVLSASGADVRVSLATGNGSFGTATVISTRPPTGWNFAGVGDVNGDARADVIWHNINSRELYYWAMSGSSIVGGQGAAYLPAGHSPLGVGDVNGDGRVDIISASNVDVRVSLASGSGGFATPAMISTRPPAGWHFAGAGDVNGSGNWDLIWHNVNSGELYYWAMSGAAIIGGQGGAYLPAGYSTIGVGDFNGDGRADILSANTVEVRLSMAHGAASFGPSAPVSTRPPSGWWLVSSGP